MQVLASQGIASKLVEGDASKVIRKVMEDMTAKVGGDGGGVAISKDGEIGVEWNSERMGWAYAKEGKIHSGVNRGEDFVEDV